MEAKLAAKSEGRKQTKVPLGSSHQVGGKELTIIAGPCSVESLEQMQEVAGALADSPVHGLRGGVHKPRTSPYSFQGLGSKGLEILSEVSKQSGLPVVTEVMSPQQVGKVARHADMLQIGSRNMQNFELLKAVGRIDVPVLLKRGLAATLEELLNAAEYIMSEGNKNVILCERGIRSFCPHTRNVLDLGAVVALKQLTHLPVIVDPSHAAGKRELIADLALAAVACGADGLIIECHPQPEESVSDARQALSLEDMKDLLERLEPVAKAVGRSIVKSGKPQLKLVENKSSTARVAVGR